jgi:hypothetical protein
MREFLCAFLWVVLLTSRIAVATETTFEGKWHTTNRKLDGTMTCVVTELGSEQWKGRFFGVWQGVPFDYTVAFSGKPSDLHGTAMIDGANYVWTGQIAEQTPAVLKGTFGGTRYTGSFDMKAKGPVAARK